MQRILIADLPEDVQQFIRSVRGSEPLLVLDDDGAVIVSIAAVPNRQPGLDRGIQIGHGNQQFNQF